ncbi:ABC-2 type transport system ATP-binding protein [Dyadobacter soli]|uniref:ABC-2 type transport system ATP-binding protein n=1 Tax=Dyadobacter soli TaxID=659014 RepID=A0A1G7ML56_9BACT|nr:ATP-binding cassette domain-containing protein [Dyadobacter soli]SDF62463.1 ABC-2 type transport system ATP-binding protein [Dyadobacter soli]
MEIKQAVIETDHLSYCFRGGEKVLDDINLSVPAGSIYGFLGPNGAGKTTTLRLLLGLLRCENPGIRLFGHQLHTSRIEIMRRTGSLIEQPSLYLHLTGQENLEVFRRAYDCPKSRAEKVLSITGLSNAAHKKVKAYSLGMKQRLSIAVALLHDPELLIMDEPTNGLDPNGIIEIRELIRDLSQNQGKTVLVSSHLLTEVEKLATHVGIIHQGRLLFQGTLAGLQNLQRQQSLLEIEVDKLTRAEQILSTHFQVLPKHGFAVQVVCPDADQAALINYMLVSGGVRVSRLGVAGNDLEKLFLQIISA